MTGPTFSQTCTSYERGQYVRVVNYHSTPVSRAPSLRAELEQYANHFVAVTLDDLDRFFDTGRWHADRPGIMPVFYEGYRNSVEVAAPICDDLGLTGWFPIATAFVDCAPEAQESFARSHWIALADEDKRGGRIAMDWDEVRDLARRHVVIPHTAHHEGFDTVVTDEDLRREVVEPKERIEAVTGAVAPAFVWLHGSPYGLSPAHDRAVREAGYRYQLGNTAITRIA